MYKGSLTQENFLDLGLLFLLGSIGGFTLPTFGTFPKCEAEIIALHWSYHFGLGSTDFQP